jgi:hypothetical protein
MKELLFKLLACSYLLTAAAIPGATPVRIIFDTDIGGDVDDAGALAVLHALADRGEAEILGVLISSKNEWAGPCVEAINTWYGRPDLPIGYQRGYQHGYPNPLDEAPYATYARPVAEAFPHVLRKSSEAPDAATLYRKLLAAQPDQNVTIVSVGILTNLRNLLNSRPDEYSKLDGESLVKQKVKQWVCMGGIFPQGKFPDGQGECNLMWDTVASVRAVNDWPTPVVFSGFAIGAAIKVGACLKETPETNPVRACYQHYNGLNNREAWDQTAVLYAVRGASNYWTLSEPGFCLMHARVPNGYNEWIPTPHKQHHYLIEAMAPAEVGEIIEALMLQPPRTRGSRSDDSHSASGGTASPRQVPR